jgi:positive regulator of sigma E activity
MEGKVASTLILFLFPALIVPLFVVFFLTRLPGALGAFFSDYSFIFLWGIYLLLAIGGFFLYRHFKRQATQQALAETATQADVDEVRAEMADVPQE